MKNLSQKSFTLLGFGAIGQAVLEGLKNRLDVVASHIVVRPERVSAVQAQVNALYPTPVVVSSQVPQDTGFVLECAGHSALKAHVLPALERGLDCAILSIGALSELGLLEDLELAAKRGSAQLHLLSGAIGGIDALAAAKLAGLKSVQYTARKPPLGWLGTVAEESLDLKNLRAAQIILQDTARQAARLYPKNANVAATISLAGLGLDLTQVCLMADPEVTQNIHEIHAHGDFGEMHITMMGKPLANNPKTSALTVLSALRFLNNQVSRVTI